MQLQIQGANVLTATYSLVAIAAEQDNARSVLSRVRQYIQATWKGFQNIDFAFLENAFNKLMQFDSYCRNRKLELYVIPALRNAGREAEALIAELESLSRKGMSLVRTVRDQLAAAFDLNAIKANEICEAMEGYCHHLAVRLEREERELIPLARRLLSIDDWFKIASQFLADESRDRGKGRYRDLPLTSSTVNMR